MRDHFIGKTH